MKKIFSLMIVLVLLAGVVVAQDEDVNANLGISYCCEKTVGGAWCQNSPVGNCDDAFRKAPASCDATSYCKMGCCYDSQEGTCMENTPQKVCQENGGVWAGDSAECEIPQCELGCCTLGEQASFVTQTRCKRLASLYGLEIDFHADIQNEVQCIASATSGVKGACVFEEDFEKTCRFVSKKECAEMGAVVVSGNGSASAGEVKFYEGKLCSDESLGTNCGPTEKTTCVEGRDEVYFVDSCGNLANIYDASRIKEKNYWSDYYDKSESCGYGKSNADSSKCGNCDYFLGSTCKEFKRSEDRVRPNVGDYICRDLSCDYEGQKYEHGETWCADAKGVSQISPDIKDSNNEAENLPGSRYFRMLCYNGEVSVEPCADFRQEVCIQDEVNGFSTAACRANKWEDCYSQDNEQDCTNIDRRDCKWVEDIELNTQQQGNVGTPFVGSGGEQEQPFVGTENSGVTGQAIFGGDKDDEDDDKEKGACVPLFPPGFDFWSGGDSQALCSMANAQCIVKYEKKLVGGKKCVENCHCLEDEWEDSMNEACIAIGDCGSKVNYIGVEGYYDSKALYSGAGEDAKDEDKKKDKEDEE